MLYLALTLWPLGDVKRARSLVRDAEARIADLAHIGSHANARLFTALFELIRSGRPAEHSSKREANASGLSLIATRSVTRR